jgi:16S rRNA (adenine1518-N6/adenine1519-N6)-dimethyltransferase
MRLTAANTTKAIINKYQFKFRKKFGQNFLLDQGIVDKIVSGADLKEGDIVVEVGPGIGTLTQALAEAGAEVIAVEIDPKLIPILDETMAPYSNVTVKHGDIMKINVDELVTQHCTKKNIPLKKYKVVANLPYYITTPIVMNLLEKSKNTDSIVVMVQKEVAERMIAPPGGKVYGALSVAVQYYCEGKIVCKVPKTVFIPPPEVESAIIRLKVLDEPKVNADNPTMFFRVVKAAFAQRRKTLLNTLTSGFSLPKEELSKVLLDNNIDPQRRGETLSLQEMANLANALNQIDIE